MTDTLKLWRGQFGTTYHERNRFTPDDVRPVFGRILHGLTIQSVLEVGSGLGHNLMAVDAEQRTGVEPNESARIEARDTYPLVWTIDGDAADLPFRKDSFDLVMTCGLLIHIPPAQIQQVVEEIARVSRRYVLAIEYAAVEEEMVEYRGEKDVLWRRPFGKLFQAWTGMSLVAWDAADTHLYPGCSWWLLEKGTT